MTTRVVVAVSAVTLLLAGPAWAQRCEHSRDVDETVDAAGAVEALLVSGAGDLRVQGVEGITEVRVRGRMCASDPDRLEDMEVRARRSGDRVEVIAETDGGGWRRGRGDHARIDLEVEVPATLALDVEDGSGDLTIRDVAAARIDDGSGNIDVAAIAGDLEIDDGSGDIDVRGAGSVRVDDGSGGIDVEDVRGDVVVEEDGSGSIEVRRVGGDFIVEDDGSGGIRYEDVAGRVETPDDHRR